MDTKETNKSGEHIQPGLTYFALGSDEYIQLGLTYFALGRYEEAIEEYNIAKKMDANNLDARYYLALVYGRGKIKRRVEAISELETIVKVNPQFRLSCLLLGDLYYDLQKFPESERWYVEALKIDDVDPWEFYSIYGFDQIPYHARVHQQLGYVIEKQGRIYEAIEHYKKALEIDPTYLLPRYNLGLKYLMLNSRDEAIEQFQEVLKIEPFFKETFYHLGRAYIAKGDLKNAVFYLQKELKNNPGNLDAQYLLASINQRMI
jgi:superkiller protein 3